MSSTLPGGTADKMGLVHEALWGVLGMIEVLNGEAECICIEEPGVDGAEFYLQRRAGREYWQAKRQVVGPKTWTIHRLAKDGVIGFFQECVRQGATCVFASVSDAQDLRMLSDNAQAAKTFENFRDHFLSKDRVRHFAELRSELDSPTDEEVFAFLLRACL